MTTTANNSVFMTDNEIKVLVATIEHTFNVQVTINATGLGSVTIVVDDEDEQSRVDQWIAGFQAGQKFEHIRKPRMYKRVCDQIAAMIR